MQYFLNFLIFVLLLAVTVWPICASIRNGLLSRRATFAGRTAEQWRADRTPYFATGGFVPGAKEPRPFPRPGETVMLLPGESFPAEWLEETPPPWPKNPTIDPASIYEHWNKAPLALEQGPVGSQGVHGVVGGHGSIGTPLRKIGKHPGLGMPYKRANACPHCDQDHEPGKCQFIIGGIDTDPGQLGGD